MVVTIHRHATAINNNITNDDERTVLLHFCRSGCFVDRVNCARFIIVSHFLKCFF